MLFKVDVARAFRNLRVDPADSLKLGIKWKDAFFVDAGLRSDGRTDPRRSRFYPTLLRSL